MKGAVFIALNEMIEDNYGISVWEEILEDVKPISGGVYISAESYPDQEIINFVLSISKKLDLPSSDVTRIFGQFLFDELNEKYPIFTKTVTEFFPFLDSIESVIHKEVRKLYKETSLPHIGIEAVGENRINFNYSSPRKLCFLAEGLIFGAAKYYDEKIAIDHIQCMHDGNDHCVLRIDRNVE